MEKIELIRVIRTVEGGGELSKISVLSNGQCLVDCYGMIGIWPSYESWFRQDEEDTNQGFAIEYGEVAGKYDGNETSKQLEAANRRDKHWRKAGIVKKPKIF